MVQAPAGYGKSSLLAEWREVSLKQGDNFAWVCLDEEDDLESVLAHLAFAFHLNGLELSDTELLQTNAQEERLSSYALRILLQAVEETSCDFVVVLDDLERLTEPISSSFLESLLRWAPENLTVVLSGRQLPPINLADFAVRGLLTDIRKEDLKFNHAEIKAVLSDYPEAAIEEIEQFTEGWPAFVRLMSVGTGPLTLYTYPVVREHLTTRLDKEFPEKVTELYQAAARWSAEQGDELMAVRKAAAIRDVELIEEILLHAGGPVTLWLKGREHLRRINARICSVPSCDSIQQSLPLIVLTDVITKAKLGRVEEARLRFEEATKQGVFNIEADSSPERQEKRQLVEFSVAIARMTLDVYSFTPLNAGVVDTLTSCRETKFAELPCLQGLIWNIDALLANESSCLERALESGKSAAIKFQLAQFHFGEAQATFHLAAANLALGRIQETAALLEKAKTLVHAHFPDDDELQIILLCLTGELQLQTAPVKLKETEQFQSMFLSTFERLGFCLDFFLAGLLQFIDRYLLQNKPEAAQEFLCECDVIARQRNATHVLRYIQFLKLITLIRSGHEDDALTLFKQTNHNGFKTRVVWREAEIHAEAVSLLAHRLNNVDIAVVDKQIRVAEQTGNQRMLLRLLAVECHRLMRFGNETAAFGMLEKLAILSSETGFYREIAVNAGNLLPLMSAYSKAMGSHVPNHEKILAIIKYPQNEAGSFEINGETPHVTPAELRILRELEHGHSDKLIASSLTISPNTVRFHLKNIYRKLGATSRSQAIRLAKQADII